MNKSQIPQELSQNIGSEKPDFIIKAERVQPLKVSVWMIVLSLFWIGFTSIFFFVFIGPVLRGKEVHFKSNKIDTVAGPDNLEPIITPAIVIGVFLLIGFIFLTLSIYVITQKGGYFAATETRLIHFKKGTLRSIDWGQFSGDIEVKSNGNTGDVTLTLKSGRMIRKKNGRQAYEADDVFMCEIDNPFGVEQICRKRIQEQAPTEIL